MTRTTTTRGTQKLLTWFTQRPSVNYVNTCFSQSTAARVTHSGSITAQPLSTLAAGTGLSPGGDKEDMVPPTRGKGLGQDSLPGGRNKQGSTEAAPSSLEQMTEAVLLNLNISEKL